MTDKPLKVAAVPYLNALPLYVGLPKLLPQIELQFLPPAEVAKGMQEGTIDVGLIPTFALLEEGMNDVLALPDIGICAEQEVLSVYVTAQRPLHQITEVLLDPESRTSVALLKVLASEIFPQNPKFTPALPGYEKDISGARAGLLIGDRALLGRENFSHKVDLSQAWYDYTGLPFVFALWAMRREVACERLVEALRLAVQLGQQKIVAITEDWARAHNVPTVLPKRYLEEHITYHVGPKEHAGLKRFIHLAIAFNLIHPQREISYYDTSAHYRSGLSGKAALSL